MSETQQIVVQSGKEVSYLNHNWCFYPQTPWFGGVMFPRFNQHFSQSDQLRPQLLESLSRSPPATYKPWGIESFFSTDQQDFESAACELKTEEAWNDRMSRDMVVDRYQLENKEKVTAPTLEQQPRSTVDVPNRTKRMRTTFTAHQLTILEQEFRHQEYIGASQRIELARTLGLSEAQVKVWWQNRRIKQRRISYRSNKVLPV